MKPRSKIRERELRRGGRIYEDGINENGINNDSGNQDGTIDVEPVETHISSDDFGNAGPPNLTRFWILLALAFVGFLLYHNGAPLYTDWLWFREVGYENVFTTTVLTRTALFVTFAITFFLLFYGNATLARRLGPSTTLRLLNERLGTTWGEIAERWIGKVLLGGALFLSLWAGRLGAENWAHWLEFHNATPFHQTDPVFGQDIGFYVFRLPLLSALYSFLLGTLLISLLAVLLIHILNQAIESLAGLRDLNGGVRAQLLVLVATIALIQAFGTQLSAYGLLVNENGIFTGAGYVDIHARLFAYQAAMVCLVFTAIACLFSIRGRQFRLPLIGAGAWLFSIVVIGGIWPGIVQKTSVDPNQFSRESEYITRNIDFTRRGFGLTSVHRVDNFTASSTLTAAQITTNSATLDSIRLWDYPYLGKVYSQTQTIKPYYRFESIAVGGQRAPNIDVDRYSIGGHERQVMLAAREIDNTSLPEAAQTWQNRLLAYTHGYGIVMSPVNRTLDGDPDYFVQGFPPTSSKEATSIQVNRPEIYYGLLAHEQVYVDTQQSEFDYPSSDSPNGSNAPSKPLSDQQATAAHAPQPGSTRQDHYTSYHGKGGIVIGDSYLRKLAFATTLNDWNLLLANNLTPQTRVLYRRDVRDRLQTVAPFLQQDGDPYLVVNPDDGRLLWFIDCYTMSDRYPYSTPQQMMVSAGTYIAPNYIRNSVKATVDAYDGTLRLYISDPADPIIRTYQRIYPGLLRPLSELSVGLRAHMRYPEDLFRLQRSVYAVYHVDDPRVFYLKEDVWAVPTEPNAIAASPATNIARTPDNSLAPANPTPAPLAQMEPYFVVMRLPDIPGNGNASSSGSENRSGGGNGSKGSSRTVSASEPEFVLMSPMAPVKKEDQNILGWMCARCDGEHYGELVLYRFPQQVSVEGPSQIVQLINSDRVISPQLSLLRQGGSSASLGNLLVIPLDQSLLYIAPLFVESSSSANKLPKLQKVIVANGTNVAMADTLDKALTLLFGGTQESGKNLGAPQIPRTTEIKGGLSHDVRNLIEQAASQYEAARQKLKQEDLAGYASQMKELEKTLATLRKAAQIK